MSTTAITTSAAWIAGLAIVALVATGWRKPARANPAAARARQRRVSFDGTDLRREVEEIDVPLDVRTSLPRKAWSALASSVIAVVVGAIVAIVVSFALALLVTRATGLLEQ